MKEISKEEISRYIREIRLAEEIDLKEKFSVNFLAQGEYNKNYLIEDENNKYVFRINAGSQLGLSNQIEYEYNALKKIEVSGYTPKAYYVDGSKKHIKNGVLVMEYLEGRPLDYDSDLKKAAEIFVGIHSLEIARKDFDIFITENYIFSDRIKEAQMLLNNFWDSQMVDARTKGNFEKLMEWCLENAGKESYFIKDPWKTVNNTEVNSHNFIVGKKRSWLIDWEKPVLSDPCQDLTQFLAPTTTLWKTDKLLSDEEIGGFFNVYERNFPGRSIRDRVKMYTPYLYLRALSWCGYAYLEYQNPEKSIKNMDTYKKIKKYLEPEFMESLLRDWI